MPSEPLYLVVWKLPPEPKPIQTVIARHVDRGTVAELDDIAATANLEGDLADLDGVFAGRIRRDSDYPFGWVVLGTLDEVSTVDPA